MATVLTSKTGVRNVRKLERPRPLKLTSNEAIAEKATAVTSPTVENDTGNKSAVPEDVIKELGNLNLTITNGNYDKNTNTAVVKLCSQLKFWGQQLEDKYKDQLDRYFETLRNASRSDLLGIHARTHLLEVIELRAKTWKNDQNQETYYKQKLSDISNMQMGGYFTSPTGLSTSATLPASFIPGQSAFVSPTHALSHSNSQATLSPGEVLKNSGKFSHPTKIPGKNFVKDEVVIRNSDSGKVGPGTRDRLVQIIGPNPDNINQAKLLIKETIQRNASPIREMPDMTIAGLMGSDSSTSLNSTASEESMGSGRLQLQQQALQSPPYSATIGSLPMSNNTDQRGLPESSKKKLIHSHSMSDTLIGEFSHSVIVGSDVLRISGVKADLVNKAKMVLEEFFAGEAELENKQRVHESLGNSNFNLKSSPFVPPNEFTSVNSVYSWGVEGKAVISKRGDSSGSNGSGSNGLPRTSSSEEDHTVKAGESSPDDENASKLSQQRDLRRSTSLKGSKFSFSNGVSQNQYGAKVPVTVMRQPIFPNSRPEDLVQIEQQLDPATQAANYRRANFSRKQSSSDSSSKEESSSHDQQSRNRSKSSPDIEYSVGSPMMNESHGVCYTRQFLLLCAKSSFSQILPSHLINFVEHSNAQSILREFPENFFNPTFLLAGPISSRWKVSPPKSESFDGGL